jgi:hypothetical protein
VLVVKRIEGGFGQGFQLLPFRRIARQDDGLDLDFQRIAIGVGAPILHLQTVAEGAAGFFEQAVDVHVEASM